MNFMVHFVVMLFKICFVWLIPQVASDLASQVVFKNFDYQLQERDVLPMCQDKFGHVG